MKLRSLFVLAAGFGLIVAAVPVSAHHAFAAEYDTNKAITITSTVTKLEWLTRTLAEPMRFYNRDGSSASYTARRMSPRPTETRAMAPATRTARRAARW